MYIILVEKKELIALGLKSLRNISFLYKEKFPLQVDLGQQLLIKK